MTQSKPQQPSRRHHYIPAFYTDRWTAGGKLIEYRLVNGRKLVSRRTAPDGTGYQNDLYAVRGLEGREKQVVEERYFSALDNDAATLVHHVTQPSFQGRLHVSDRHLWARFLISFLYRSPEDIDRIRKRHDSLLSRDDPEIQRRWEEIREPDQPLLLRDILNSRTHPEVDLSFFGVLIRQLQSEVIGNFIVNMRWSVVDLSSASIPLLTSDRPMVMSNGLRAENGHIALPLSPTHLFIAAKDRAVAENFWRLTPNQMSREVNRNVVQGAHRFVYAQTDSQRLFIERNIGIAPQWRPSSTFHRQADERLPAGWLRTPSPTFRNRKT